MSDIRDSILHANESKGLQERLESLKNIIKESEDIVYEENVNTGLEFLVKEIDNFFKKAKNDQSLFKNPFNSNYKIIVRKKLLLGKFA